MKLTTSTPTKFSLTTNTTTYSTRKATTAIPTSLKEATSHQNPNIELLTSEKRNIIISGDSIPKGINTRLLNTNLIKSKAICKRFLGASSNDFIHYIKPTLQNPQNPFESAI